MDADGEFRPVPPRGVVEADRAVRDRKPPPGPVAEILFQRAGAEIRVEIAMPGDLPARAEIDLDIRGGREGAPDMGAIPVSGTSTEVSAWALP
jgi:hypothetical protein